MHRKRRPTELMIQSNPHQRPINSMVSFYGIFNSMCINIILVLTELGYLCCWVWPTDAGVKELTEADEIPGQISDDGGSYFGTLRWSCKCTSLLSLSLFLFIYICLFSKHFFLFFSNLKKRTVVALGHWVKIEEVSLCRKILMGHLSFAFGPGFFWDSLRNSWRAWKIFKGFLSFLLLLLLLQRHLSNRFWRWFFRLRVPSGSRRILISPESFAETHPSNWREPRFDGIEFDWLMRVEFNWDELNRNY